MILKTCATPTRKCDSSVQEKGSRGNSNIIQEYFVANMAAFPSVAAQGWLVALADALSSACDTGGIWRNRV